MDQIENKNLFQTVFNSSPNGIAVLQPLYDKDGIVTDFTILLLNDYILRWLGGIEYKGRIYSETFPIVRESGMLEKFTEVANTGISAIVETDYDLDNKTYWFLLTAVWQDNLLVITTENITERKRAEMTLKSALEESERQHRLYYSVTNNTPDLVYVFGLDYRFTYANKALLDMWGKTEMEAVGKGLRENGYEEWHAQMHEREIDEIVAKKKPLRGTVAFPHAELGSRIYDYILVPVINADGDVEAIAGTTRDVTDLKQVEERLRESETRLKTMIDQTPTPTLVLMGERLAIEQINASMLRMIGRGEEVIGTPLIEIMPELDGQYIWEQVKKVYQEGTHFDQWEVCVPHMRTGVMQDYYYNIAYRPLWESGKITGMIQVAIDVTEQVSARKKLEESESSYRQLSVSLEQQVKDRTKELNRSNQDLQQFAHVASHDLKEPIRKISIFSERLTEHLGDKIDDTAASYLKRMLVAAERMFAMIEGVLHYSTVNAGEQPSEPVDLNAVLQSIETDLEIALQKSGAQLAYSNLPTIEGAHVLLYQMFYNLINNSIKFAKPGVPPIISITSASATKAGKEYAVITLSDNGIGFDSAFAEHIFETFTRLNPKDKYEGTGLGLSLCKKIAERHSGSIIAKGDTSEGATFIITLPFRQEESGI